jgi:plastocyanin
MTTLLGACVPGQATPSTSASAAGQAQVMMRGLAYEPADLEIAAGTTVTWVNGDVAAHDVTAADGSFASGTLQEGETYSLTFDRPGTWAYTCTLHPEMTGLVKVR